MKKILPIIIINIFLLSTSYSEENNESVDYTKGNSNPFFNYKYSTPQQQAQEFNNLNYFKNNIANPLESSKTYTDKNPVSNQNSKISSKHKYHYLIQNKDQLSGCWEKAAQIYKLDPWLLMAIAKVESSFNSKAVNLNKNKTSDFGMMQINEIWLPTLNKFGISKEDLFNPCKSVFIGAWILAQNIQHFGYNLDGIGAYNSPRNVTIRRKYAQKVYQAYNELTHDLYYSKKK